MYTGRHIRDVIEGYLNAMHLEIHTHLSNQTENYTIKKMKNQIQIVQQQLIKDHLRNQRPLFLGIKASSTARSGDRLARPSNKHETHITTTSNESNNAEKDNNNNKKV